MKAVDKQWYRQAVVELGYRITMFTATDGIAISRGTGSEYNGRAYRFKNGAWSSIREFPYSDYPLIVSVDSTSTYWTINHLTHQGAYRPVHTKISKGEMKEIPIPRIMWDEIDHVMYKGIHQFNDGTAWMVGQQGHILYFDGYRWNEVESPLIRKDRMNVYDGDLNDVYMLSQRSGWAVGRDGMIIRYKNGTWSRFPSPTQSNLLRIKFANEENGWAVGEKGTIIRWNGKEWNNVATGTRETLNSLKVLDVRNVWAVGNSSTLLKYNGSSWEKDESITLYDDVLADIDIVKDKTGKLCFWIIGNQGIYTTSNSMGFSFTDITGQASLRRSGRGGIFFNRSSEDIPDLLVLNEGGINLLYENNSGNIYSDVTESAGLLDAMQDAGTIGIGDVNNDGYTDILQIIDHSNFSFHFGTMFGGFRDATAFSQLSLTEMNSTVSNSARFVDLDNDGNIDLYISNFDLPDQILKNDGTGRFIDVTNRTAINKLIGHASYGATFGDFNNDGLTDIFIPYYVSKNNKFFDLYINLGDFRFKTANDSVFYSDTDISPTVAVAHDFNNDGYCDIFIHNQKAPPYLLLNDGNAHFSNVASSVGLTAVNFHAEPSNGVVAVADVDNDGWTDIFDGSKLYLNSQSFHFIEVSERVGIQFSGNPSFADIDNDGDLDLFIGSSRIAMGKGDRAVLFRNNLNPDTFVKIKVNADKSNRSGIGTKIFHGPAMTTVGLNSSPMLPQFAGDVILSRSDSVMAMVRAVFPSGNIVVSDGTGDCVLNESGFPVRTFVLMSRSVQRTFLLLEWKNEIPKFVVFALLWFGLMQFGKRIGTEKFVRSRGFLISGSILFVSLVHLFSGTSTIISFAGNISLLGCIGFISIIVARSVIQKREAQYISHYKIIRQIGAGGMGKVYKAIDTTSKKIVALKVLNPELLKDPENRRRLSVEGHLLASFNHPNIVKVYETGESHERGFIAMEFLAAGTLKEKLERMQPLPLREIKEYILQVCGGLTEVHSKGIVHRDLKSGNLMIGEDGGIRIMDFGLSKSPLVTTMTSMGTVLGTLGYVAPEQVTSVGVDPRTDIFSLGVVLYELLTNQMPFKGENEIAMIHSIFNTIPVPPSHVRNDVTEEWDTIVMKCLAKEMSERYNNAAEVQTKIRDIHIDA